MNEQTKTMDQPIKPPVKTNDVRAVGTYPEARTSSTISPQAGCATCGGPGGAIGSSPNGTGMPSYVYAIGRVEARFPNLAAEKEFAQATGRADTVGKTDQQTFHAVMSKRENRYLIRQLCWVLTIQ